VEHSAVETIIGCGNAKRFATGEPTMRFFYFHSQMTRLCTAANIISRVNVTGCLFIHIRQTAALCMHIVRSSDQTSANQTPHRKNALMKVVQVDTD